MAEIDPISPSIPDKSTGQQVTATEFNAIKNKVVQLVTFINNMFGTDHLLKSTILPESILSPDQFELNGTTGFIELINYDQIGTGGGDPKLNTPTISFGTSTTSQNVVNWTSVPNATSYTLQALISSVWTTIYTGALLTYTHGSLASGTAYQYRVKASASGYTDSNYATGTKSTETEGGYVVEQRIFVNFSDEYATLPTQTTPYYWNSLNPADSVLSTINGYTSTALKTDQNVTSALTLTNSAAFGGATAQIDPDQNDNSGVFEDLVVNTAWSFTGSSAAKLKINNVNSAKYVHLYFLLPNGSSAVTRSVTIGGVEKQKVTSTAYSGFGTAGNGLADPEFIVFNNLTGATSIEATLTRISGDFGAFVSAMVIEVSNSPKP